jgi:pimeloyl-ACP methyl ester carboxylesterase
LATGVALNVVEAGPADAPPVILLHGFPESHRTWRGIAPLLQDRFRLVMPDQRGFGASDRPLGVAAYAPEILIADIFALADALGIGKFALVGHDWGGAIAWPAALARPDRLTHLAVINAPHPWLFQKSLIDDPAQRAASQYITAFRDPAVQAMIEAQGFDWFFDKSFAPHVDAGALTAGERQHYIDDWSRPGALEAMLNWYRSTNLVVPGPSEEAVYPAWMDSFPKLTVPTLVVWGMRDHALLPIQLDGLDDWIDDLTIIRIPEGGHFIPWERPTDVAAALGDFL